MSKKFLTPTATPFKLRIVALCLRNLQVSRAANDLLPAGQQLSEQMITRLITGRKVPSPEQAAALASVLSVEVEEIFQTLETAVPNE